MFLIFQFTIIFIITNIGICQIPKTQKLEEVIRLKNLGNESIVVGDRIEFECQTTFQAKHILIKWKTPKDVVLVISKSVNLKENTNSNYVTTSTLIIPKAKIQHSGLYICEIIHKKMNYTLAMRNISIIVYSETIGWEDPTLEVISSGPKTITANAEFELLVKAFSYVQVISYTQDYFVKNSPNTRISVKLTNDGEKNVFKIMFAYSYITLNDLKSHFIVLKNRFNSKTFEINFELVNSISMDFVGINEDDMIAVYKCSAIGNNKPNINWEFKKCDTFECIFDHIKNDCCSERVILKELHHEDRGLQITSYISVNLTDTGFLQCIFGDLKATKRIFYTQNEFEFFFMKVNYSNKIKYDRIEAQRIAVGYEQPAVALCIRSLYKYTSDIFWYHNDNNINERHWLHPKVVSNSPQYKTANQLFISFPVEDQLGNLTCQVFTRTGDVESKTVEVVSKSMGSFHRKVSSLEDLNGGHTTAEEDINLKCNVSYYERVDIEWHFIYDENGDQIYWDSDFSEKTYIQTNSEKTVETVTDSNVHITTSYLTIAQVNSSNTGYYHCKATGYPLSRFPNRNSIIWVKVYDLNDTTLIFKEKNNFDKVNNMSIKILMTAHPPPIRVNWFDNHGKEISSEPPHTSNFLSFLNQIFDRRKYKANYEVTLKFKNIETADFGNYTVVAENEYGKVEYSIEVNVTGTPTAKMDIYNTTMENATFKCSSIAYPKPTIEWYFKKCITLECCLDFNITNSELENKRELWSESKGVHRVSYITVNLSNRGVLVCRSANSFGENFTYEPILGFDNDEFDISIENPDNSKYLGKTFEFVDRDEFKAICAISKTKYQDNFLLLEDLKDFVIDNNSGLYPWAQLDFVLSSFSILTIQIHEMEKDYSCNVLKKIDGFFKSQVFHVKIQSFPSLKIIETNMVDNNTVHVDLTSKWKFYCYAEGFPTPTIKWYKNNQNILDSEKFKYSNDGQVLEIDYVDPDHEGIYKCEVKNKYLSNVKYSSLNVVIKNPWPYVQAMLLLLALCFVGILALIRFRTERKVKKKLKLLGLFYLEKDSWNKVCYKAGTEDDIVLLPFDRKWEIPFENIKIGKRLGSGAFGITFQADVVNFFPNNSVKTVAVKTVNSDSGLECAKALVSELKILSHLGSHVNIVNFLGACTQHIVRDELYIVLEFCTLGNLLEYIKQHSENFIDQKDYDSDAFDWTSDTDEDEKSQNRNSVSSKDFLIWSFQIARGMEFLGSRRVVHGDLAARNILLTDENVVKICDFGLAKNVYNYGKYIRKSQGPLPLKWMALETMRKGIFSAQSDVWSFGVVLWEFFSLGEIPYPGVVIDENFCDKLLNGYRMKSPRAATTKIYKIMLSCWELNPEMRPSFTDLADQIGSFLEGPVKNYYIDMNNPYTLMNKQQFEGDFDYLTMISPISYQNLGPAHYENFQLSHSSDSTNDKLETK